MSRACGRVRACVSPCVMCHAAVTPAPPGRISRAKRRGRGAAARASLPFRFVRPDWGVACSLSGAARHGPILLKWRGTPGTARHGEWVPSPLFSAARFACSLPPESDRFARRRLESRPLGPSAAQPAPCAAVGVGGLSRTQGKVNKPP